MIPKGLAISKRRLVLVEWIDAAGDTESLWQNVQEAVKDDSSYTCYSVGWILRETDSHLTLAPHFGNVDDEDAEQMQGVLHIPKPMIRKQRTLKIP